jgi:hypothetical protein
MATDLATNLATERNGLFLNALAALTVLVTVLAPIEAANAGGNSCDAGDLVNAVVATINQLSSADCAGVSADPALWAPVGAASAIMAGVSQSQQFCQGVQNVQGQLTNIQGDGNSLVSGLNNLGVDASFLSTALGALGSAADALAVVECACGLSNNITQVGGDIGGCIQDGLCDLQNLAHQIDPAGFGSCSGTIVNVPTNCTQNPCQSNGACDPNLGGNVITRCPAGDDAPPVVIQPGLNGGVTVSSVLGADANGNISVQSCICPPPMVGQWITAGDYAQSGNFVDDPACQFFMCTCPQGSTPASSSGAGAYLCICQNTNTPVRPPGATTDNPEGVPCPVPLTGLPCPNGQTRVGNDCVPTCAADQVLLANGTCCAASQASSCGSCCPSGEVPDSSGNCSALPKLPTPRSPVRR